MINSTSCKMMIQGGRKDDDYSSCKMIDTLGPEYQDDQRFKIMLRKPGRPWQCIAELKKLQPGFSPRHLYHLEHHLFIWSNVTSSPIFVDMQQGVLYLLL